MPLLVDHVYPLPLLPPQADSGVYQAEKQVKELGDKAPAENKQKVEDKIKVRREGGLGSVRHGQRQRFLRRWCSCGLGKGCQCCLHVVAPRG